MTSVFINFVNTVELFFRWWCDIHLFLIRARLRLRSTAEFSRSFIARRAWCRYNQYGSRVARDRPREPEGRKVIGAGQKNRSLIGTTWLDSWSSAAALFTLFQSVCNTVCNPLLIFLFKAIIVWKVCKHTSWILLNCFLCLFLVNVC